LNRGLAAQSIHGERFSPSPPRAGGAREERGGPEDPPPIRGVYYGLCDQHAIEQDGPTRASLLARSRPPVVRRSRAWASTDQLGRSGFALNFGLG
jgi:hypothetical protein